MSTPKTGLDMALHQEIGLELARIRDRLTVLSAEIGNAYPKDRMAARLADRVVGPLDRLRAELDIRMFTEHSNDDAATIYVYYPQPETRDGVPEDPPRLRPDCRRPAPCRLFSLACGGAMLRQLRHSALTHDAGDGKGVPMLMARSVHVLVRVAAGYAKVSAEALARRQAWCDPARG